MAKIKCMQILRLPRFHVKLNPIELIWIHLKGYGARRNSTYKLTYVQRLFLPKVDVEIWKKAYKMFKK